MAEETAAKPSFSWKRTLITVIPLAAIVAGVGFYLKNTYETQAKQFQARPLNQVFQLDRPVVNRLNGRYTDADNDLVADCPVDEAEQLTPETLTFCYITDGEEKAPTWQPLTDALAEATGIPVQYTPVATMDDLYLAIREGDIHICGLNTGAVPRAVSQSGFVPIATLADADGNFGYTMKIIVPANSKLKEVGDLHGQTLTFTSRDSNSGFKAPVVLLRKHFDLDPRTDYDHGFSTSHEESILRVAKGQVKAAAVASDMLDKLTAREEAITSESYKELWSSERFPPAALGSVHNLAPEITDKVRDVLIGFQFADTPLAEEFGASGVTQLVEVNFKDDWAVIRLIDEVLGQSYESK